MSDKSGEMKRLARHSGIYLIANIINRGGAFLLIPVYTRFLSVAEYGALELVYSFSLVVTVLLSAGMSHATLRFYYEYKDLKSRNEVITTNFFVTFVMGLVGCSVLVFFSEPVCLLLLDSLQYQAALIYCCLLILFNMTSEILLAYLRAVENSWLYVVTSVLKFLIQVSLSYYLLVYQNGGVSSVMAANLASSVVTWMALVVFCARQCGTGVDFAKTRRIMSYSFPFLISSLLGVAAGNMDRFVLKHFLTLQDVGIYGLGTKLGMILLLAVSEPFYRAYGAYRFSIMEREDAKEIQILALKLIVAVAVFAGLGISLISPDLITLMATEKYEGAQAVVPFVLAGHIFSTATYCFQTGILYQRKPRYILYINSASLAASLALNFALVPVLGAVGAGVSFLLVKVVESLLTNAVSQSIYPMRYDFRALFGCLALALVIYGFVCCVETGSLLVSMLYKLLGVMAYPAVLAAVDRDIREVVLKNFGKLISCRVVR